MPSIPFGIGLQMAAKGIADNFISEIKCGSCGTEWKDGLRYKNKTIVKCPKCKKYNCVDTSYLNVL
jgi:predicted Zn-ribbon and HTH transcriptional regulator